MKRHAHFDEIGYWSEVKLEILKKYASAYSKILSSRQNPRLYHVYIDAFAGAGIHLSKSRRQLVLGSPLNALAIDPPFRELFLIDLDSEKVAGLRKMTAGMKNVHVFEGDCNEVLLADIFPNVRFEDYRRGLCILDPYGLHLDWKVIATAAQSKTIEIFLNFPVADMNRNVLWHDPEKVDPVDIARMNRFWGDESWRSSAYRTDQNLFGIPEKEPNEAVAEGFRERLQTVAGFKRVPRPLPMRNSKGAVVYYLFFAAQQDTAEKIVIEIFEKYRITRN